MGPTMALGDCPKIGAPTEIEEDPISHLPDVISCKRTLKWGTIARNIFSRAWRQRDARQRKVG
jgi:hypothetical protein